MTLCGACALLLGCQRPDVGNVDPTEIENLEKEQAAWARTQPRPSEKLVAHVEALLAMEPCVGRLERWARYYAYNHDGRDTLYPEIVDFHLEEAGTPGVRPGKHVTEPNSWIGIDDRPIKMASGSYDIQEDRIKFAHCGNNVGPDTSGRSIDRIGKYYDELEERRSELRRAR